MARFRRRFRNNYSKPGHTPQTEAKPVVLQSPTKAPRPLDFVLSGGKFVAQPTSMQEVQSSAKDAVLAIQLLDLWVHGRLPMSPDQAVALYNTASDVLIEARARIDSTLDATLEPDTPTNNKVVLGLCSRTQIQSK